MAFPSQGQLGGRITCLFTFTRAFVIAERETFERRNNYLVLVKS